MKEFIKQNWFKIIIAISIIFVCFSVGYYFIVYLPKEKATKNQLDNQVKCQQEGNKLYESLLNEDHTGTFGNPEFKFNKNLNTCLYKGLFIDAGYTEHSIIDVYTNKSIIIWSNVKEGDKWKDIYSSEEEWNLKVKELFGEK